MSDYEFKKYCTTIENLKNTLNLYGVAIIPSVLNQEECNNIYSGIWDFLEYISKPWDFPLNRNNKNSWKGFYELYPIHSMLLKNWHIGHSQVCWDVRQNPKILNIFSQLWNCKPEELLSSFDARIISFARPCAAVILLLNDCAKPAKAMFLSASSTLFSGARSTEIV